MTASIGTRVIKEKGKAAEVDVALSGEEDTKILIASYEDNTSQGKG